MFSKKLMIVLGLLIVASMVLAACAQPTPETITETVVETVVVTEVVEKEGETVVETVIVTVEPEMPVEEPVDEGPRTLVVCQGQEPDSLNYYVGDMLAKSNVLEAIYEGANPTAIDTNSFGYQAVIHEKLPSLADGDAVLNAVAVTEGDTIVDADQNPVTLEVGMMVVPAGESDPVEYTGGEIELDQLAVTFKLLPGLLWSDGTPVTAADSVYSFSVASDPDTPSGKFQIERTASYEALDDVTVIWTGLPGYKDSSYFINFWGPLPEHVWGQYTALELHEAEETSRLPMGYGAYIIDEWVQGDHITLQKNPNYFRADEGLPVFDTVVWRFVGENSNANIAGILSGECDIVDQTSGLDDQSELLLELQGAGQLNATFVTGTVWEHVDYGIQPISYDDGYDGGISDRPDFFSDLRMRQAFLMCMDRQAVVDTAFYGQSIVLDSYLPPQHPLFNADVTHYDFDVAGGVALLEEVGWMDDDGDPATPRIATGVEGVPDGTPLTVAYETTTATLRAQITQIIANSLGQCGINAELVYYPAGEWFADGPEGKLFGRRFDLGEFAWLTGVQPPCDLYLSDLTTGPDDGTWIPVQDPEAGPQTFASGWGGQNDPGFYNAEYDAVCKAALSSLPGQPEYEAAHLEAQALFADLLPVAPLALRLKLAATRPDMCNFIMDPTSNSEFWNIEEFDYGDCAE